jgi:hypothetical protein
MSKKKNELTKLLCNILNVFMSDERRRLLG